MSLRADEPLASPVPTPDRRLGLVCRMAVLLAVVGVFGTWRSAGPVSLDGVEGPHDGWLLIVFALIGLAGVRSLSRHGWLGIVTVLGAACAMLYTTVGNLLDDRAVFGGNAGWGLWLTIGASVVLAGCGLWAVFGPQRGRGAGDLGVLTTERNS